MSGDNAENWKSDNTQWKSIWSTKSICSFSFEQISCQYSFWDMMVTHKTQENTDGHGWTEEQKDGWRQSHNVMVTGEGKNSLTECKKKKKKKHKTVN